MGEGYCDASPEYWEDYSNLQHVKHSLIREYLKGWFPKLGFWAGRILYIDTHAGRGRYGTGHLGSPLVALQTLLAHSHRDRILARSEVRFVFIEQDRANLATLEAELGVLGQLPPNVAVELHAEDCEETLIGIIRELRGAGLTMAPSFVFVDPYGFKVQYSVLHDLMSFERVELFTNVMWRHLDMALSQAGAKLGMARTLDLMFGTSDWRSRITSADFNARADQTLDLVREKISARWMTSVRMLGKNNATKYVLAHLTNHQAGRDLMKETMWKVCPVGKDVFFARQAEDPMQGVLLEREPDLRPLAEWLLAVLRQGPTRWQSLDDPVRDSLWLRKHLNSVVRDLRHRGFITAGAYAGHFSHKANPLLSLKTGA